MAADDRNHRDTIVAISTPPGRGGIGIVRLSGPRALDTAARLVVLRPPWQHARAAFTRVLDPANNGNTLDDAVVTAFLAPHSYTREDLVEVAAHGSPVVLAALVRGALAFDGVRLAEPGEFTQRAFLAGRLDLTQAEAIHDLIAAQTIDQARIAAQQMGGALARQVAPAKGDLLHLIALLEAGMDFASGELDDVDVVPPAQIAAAIASVQHPLTALAATFRRGQLLREGAAIALVGRPNAGKSSLFNRLLARERAIVTPIPGTTRDTLEETFALAGIPLRLIDTAGLRLADDPTDEAESQGIARTREAVAEADLVLLVHDATRPWDDDEIALAEQIAGRPHLLITSKIDIIANQPDLRSPESNPGAPHRGPQRAHLLDGVAHRGPQRAHLLDGVAHRGPQRAHLLDGVAHRGPQRAHLLDGVAHRGPQRAHLLDGVAHRGPQRAHLLDGVAHRGPQRAHLLDGVAHRGPQRAHLLDGVAPLDSERWDPHTLRTSAITGQGLDQLRSAILEALNAGGSLSDTAMLNNVRQQQAVAASLQALAAAAAANSSGLPHELILLDLHSALGALDALTGVTTTEDILARIFSTFCIGK